MISHITEFIFKIYAFAGHLLGWLLENLSFTTYIKEFNKQEKQVKSRLKAFFTGSYIKDYLTGGNRAAVSFC